jgi:Uma2 family endonuclease
VPACPILDHRSRKRPIALVFWRQNLKRPAAQVMATTTTRLSFAEYAELPENDGVVYELDEGELLMEPSPALRHNLVRQRIAMRLMEFVEKHGLGLVIEEMDFRLGEDTVRNPDVALIDLEHSKKLDLDRSPVEGAPALAVEVISPHNRADDMARKIHQYLDAGSLTVWVVYPSLRMVEVHTKAAVRQVREPETLQAENLLRGFSLTLSYIFDGHKPSL